MNVWSLCIHPAVCLVCVLCLRSEIFVPFSFLWLCFSGWKNTRKSGTKQKSLTLYVQLSAYPCTCLPSLFLALQSPRNSSLKIFFTSYLLTAAKMATCPSRGWAQCFRLDRELLAVPWSVAKLFLKVSPVSTLIWATGCRLLLRFCCGSFHMTQWPTYLFLSLMGHILAYLALRFTRVIRKKRPLSIWWLSPPTSPQVKCAAIPHFCSCVIE